MTITEIENNYNKLYKDIDFERTGLFETISKNYKHEFVLYPGCSIHITPSFYFPHVIYLDKSDLSRKFFSDLDNLKIFINKYKVYKRSTYIKYYFIDYKKDFCITENKFDLILSIFSDEVTTNFKNLITKNGVIIVNNYENQILSIINDNDLELIEIVYKKKNKYIIEKKKKTDVISFKRKKNIIKKNDGIKFIDTDIYYVFKNTRL